MSIPYPKEGVPYLPSSFNSPLGAVHTSIADIIILNNHHIETWACKRYNELLRKAQRRKAIVKGIITTIISLTSFCALIYEMYLLLIKTPSYLLVISFAFAAFNLLRLAAFFIAEGFELPYFIKRRGRILSYQRPYISEKYYYK